MSDNIFSSKSKQVVQSLYDYGSRLDKSSKRAMVAEFSASLVGVGLDKLEKMDPYKKLGDFDYENTKSHFSDKLIDKLIQNAVPSNEKDALTSKLQNEYRSSKPSLSIRLLIRNFKTLSSKLDLLFKIQYGIVKIVSWKDPCLTLSFLVLYTWGCIHLYLFLIYPFIFIIGYSLLPNYLYRHPVNINLVEMKERGGSIFGFLKEDEEWKAEMEEIRKEREAFFHESESRRDSDEFSIDSLLGDSSIADFDKEILKNSNLSAIDLMKLFASTNKTGYSFDSDDESSSKDAAITLALAASSMRSDSGDSAPTSSSDSGVNRTQSTDDTVGNDIPEASGTRISSKINLLINMRDLQNLTTDIIKLIENIEVLVQEYTSFKDEKKSTLFFFQLILVVISIMLFGPFIPWRVIFIVSVWVLFLYIHPKRLEYIATIKEQQRDMRGFPPSLDDLADSDLPPSLPSRVVPPPVPPRRNVPAIRPPSVRNQVNAHMSSRHLKLGKVTTQEALDNAQFKRKSEMFIDNLIVVDEEPEIKTVEIFEIEQRGLTPHQFIPFLFSNSIYDKSSVSRNSNRKPKGVPMIHLVKAPISWKFKDDSDWEIDTNPKEWCSNKVIDKYISFRSDSDQEGWVYDADDDETQFRRRRYTRVCLRYSKPARKFVK
ncbi:hypothetical protein BVG19_g3175 [[Candida] boidinii]|nr:hypothetical protein BVG19_g3175 [[Candida] boidinii]OWB52458.1 hypothetical protein B5S27_g4033 [[Candida] boidinii]